MPHVRKGAKHASNKLTIANDTDSEATSTSKHQRQKLRKATQKTSDEILDELLAEQLQVTTEATTEPAPCKTGNIQLALALNNVAHSPQVDNGSDGCERCMPTQLSDFEVPRPISLGPLREGTGATFTPRTPEPIVASVAPAIHQIAMDQTQEQALRPPLVSDVQQLHIALPDMLAKALEKQLAPLVAHQHHQSSLLQAFEQKHKDIVARLEKLESARDSSSTQRQFDHHTSTEMAGSGSDVHVQPPASQRSAWNQTPRSRSVRRTTSSPPVHRVQRSASVPDARTTCKLVLQGFARKYSLDEFKQLARSTLRLPHHTLVLSRALYANKCTIILASREEALHTQKCFKDDPRFDGESRLYANWVVSQLEAKKGWIFRAARRTLTSHSVQEVRVCYRSASVWTGRETVVYVAKNGSLQFTDKWPQCAAKDKAELLRAFEGTESG
eukprot:6492357-Amphidinium_carterae.1